MASFSEAQGAPETLDDVLTYILIGTVVSGSEMRKETPSWWTKAWVLAKRMNMNQEQDEDEAWETAEYNGSQRKQATKEEEFLLAEEYAVRHSSEFIDYNDYSFTAKTMVY